MGTLLDLASLVVVPSGYKEDIIYSVVPTDGSGDLDFTRASDATRVNSAGLIEKVRTNLALYSEEFDNAYWSKPVGWTVTPNATTSPTGTLTADEVTPTNFNSLNRSFSVSSSTSYTPSIYLKKNTTNFSWVSLSFSGGAAINYGYQLDWSTFTITLISGRTAAVSPKFESVGNGWYRISFGCASGNNTSASFQIIPDSSAGTNSLYLWGAQYETGDIATDYIPTTTAAVSVGMTADVPRLDYLGSSCPSLLLEPQRTNGHTFSENFDNAAWSKLNATISANAAVSPSGYQDADKLIDNSTSGTHVAFQAYSFASAAAHTISVFAKAAEITSINIFNNVVAGFNATFNLSNGTVTSVASGGTATITAYGNGWYRCAVTATASIAFTNTQFRLVQSGNTSYVGNGTDGAFIWGAQIETGSYVTSYIPSLSTSVTRVADVASKTGISSLIGQTEGTLFAEVDLSRVNTNPLIVISDGGDANRIQISFLSATTLFATIRVAGVSANYSVTIPTIPAAGGVYKMALGYKVNDYCFALNGTTYADTSSRAVPACNKIGLGTSATELAFLNDRIAQAIVFPTRLSNTELAQLTTL
jgi:hypothetical protein